MEFIFGTIGLLFILSLILPLEIVAAIIVAIFLLGMLGFIINSHKPN